MTINLKSQRDIVLRPGSLSDRARVEGLLTELALPVDGVSEWLDRFWIAEHEGDVVGVAGLEMYGPAALLRSVAVAPSWRSSGLGRALVERALDTARREGVRDIYLLTTTAEHYFPRLGFGAITRDEVPAGVQDSVEFRGACPDSAVVMRRSLDSPAVPPAAS